MCLKMVSLKVWPSGPTSEHMLKVQILGPHSRPRQPETVDLEISTLNKFPKLFYTH